MSAGTGDASNRELTCRLLKRMRAMVSFTESGMSGCSTTMILRDFGSVISDLTVMDKA